MRHTPSRDIGGFIDLLLSDPHIAQNITARQDVPERRASYGTWPEHIRPEITGMLAQIGLKQPYQHQQSAIEAALSGEDLVISTGVASGKSICYQVPILQSKLTLDRSKALLLYPTKALAQDQHKKLLGMLIQMQKAQPKAGKIDCGIYDGDTHTDARRLIRNKADIIFSNPDMLHGAILPNHTLWSSFFAGLKWVIIDEVHIYRGVFGSHFANIIRRLKRVCALYGSDPRFICTSATVANAAALAQDIIERPVRLIDSDASPHGEQVFMILNPPMIDTRLGIRRSSVVESVSLAKRFLASEMQALLFTISRRSVEILFMYLANNPELVSRVRSYRSGYLAEERRQIENELRDRDISMVVSTNALELGIDIGGLDAVFMNGYPGTISATRQQAGRAGRAGNTSLCVMVASANPLDQYICQHPEYLFGNNPEAALISPNHHEILQQQLLCAVHDMALLEDEYFGSLSPAHIIGHLQILVEDGRIRKVGNRYVGVLNAYPAAEVSIRNITSQLQINHGTELIGYIDRHSALWMTHPSAVYLDKGDTWLVTNLDLELGRVEVRPEQVNYLTQATRDAEIELTQMQSRRKIRGGDKYFGQVKVTNTVVGFKKLRMFSQEVLGYEELDLPPMILDTEAWWIALAPETVASIREQGLWRNDPRDYGKAWTRLKDLIRERDRFRCGHCGLDESGKAFDVHHIRPLRMFPDAIAANHPDNLITLCPRCHRLAEASVRVQSGLAGLGYLLVNLSPFYVMCDRKDLDVFVEERSSLAGDAPVIAIYDTIPGGIGLSRKLHEMHEHIFSDALRLVRECACEDGCPACVGPVAENGAGAKEHAIAILKACVKP